MVTAIGHSTKPLLSPLKTFIDGANVRTSGEGLPLKMTATATAFVRTISKTPPMQFTLSVFGRGFKIQT